VDVVTHHGMKSWIGHAVLKTLIDIRLELGRPQRLNVQHGYIRHDVSNCVERLAYGDWTERAIAAPRFGR
jgi:hypothetical protein